LAAIDTITPLITSLSPLADIIAAADARHDISLRFHFHFAIISYY